MRRSEESMTIRYMMHAGICVRDLDRALRFYRDGLGFEEAGGLEISGEPTATLVEIPGLELRAVYLDRDGFRIELLHYPSPGTVGGVERRPMNQPGLTHLAFRVENLDDAIAKLVPLGATVLEHTRVHEEEYEAHIIYLTDPDGTRLELVQTPNDPTRP
jgi:catechol 2,3-dioxygenase-like lactoylglutathione lyase family enzyme